MIPVKAEYLEENKCSINVPLTKRGRDFPWGPVVRTSPSNVGDASSIPGWGAKLLHSSLPKNQIIKQNQYCSKLRKDF